MALPVSVGVSLCCLVCCWIAVNPAAQGRRYEPTWDSIDSRPLPQWYDDAKFGIFIHWGVFSVPSFGSEWFWNYWQNENKDYVDFVSRNYRPNFTYPDFAPGFTAEFYDPDEWADLFQASGAKYVVLTSKHHEGFTLWPSKYSWNWNSVAVGPKRDLVGDLAAAIRSRTNITFGLYYSHYEWFHPLYLQDQASGFETRDFPLAKATPELYELVNKYKPSVVWSDGDAASDTYWNSTGFLAWLYNDSPVKDSVVTNDRWGIGAKCKHGGFYTCANRYNPGTLQTHKWENAMTIDAESWGYRRNAKLSDFLNVTVLLQTLVETVSCGGNLLMNIGPTHDGRIVPVFEERLRAMGSWLKVNGEAIYESKPWIHQNDTVTKGVWYTQSVNSSAVYALVLLWPSSRDNQLQLGSVEPLSGMDVTMVGHSGPKLVWTKAAKGINVTFPQITPITFPPEWAWVLKITAKNIL